MKRNLLLGVLLSSYCFGAVFDTIPSDYVAPKVGLNAMSINVLDRSSIGPHAKGKKLTNDSIVQKTYYLRYNYGSSFLGYTTSYGVAFPFTKVQTKGTTLENALGGKSTGWSDFVLSSTLWLLNDREKREYLGVTFLLATPSGNYDESQILNTSENRYKYILNMGYIKPLSEKLILELSPELAFYGNNTTSTSTTKQKPSFALNTNLRHRVNRTYEIFGGYQYSYNSETTINKTEQNNQHNSNKYSVGGFYYTKKHHQFMLRYAKENSKEFGMQIEDEFLLRYRWWF